MVHRAAAIVRFPLQPRIRRQTLAATILEQSRPPDASDVVQGAFIYSVLATSIAVGVGILPELLTIIAGIPSATFELLH